MMMGAVVVSACLLVLGFTREIVGAFTVGSIDSDSTRRFTVILAVAAIYAVDFAINASESCLLDCLLLPLDYLLTVGRCRYTVMSCARSLIVDTLPIEKQQAGAAWGESTISSVISIHFFIC